VDRPGPGWSLGLHADTKEKHCAGHIVPCAVDKESYCWFGLLGMHRSYICCPRFILGRVPVMSWLGSMKSNGDLVFGDLWGAQMHPDEHRKKIQMSNGPVRQIIMLSLETSIPLSWANLHLTYMDRKAATDNMETSISYAGLSFASYA
jgi:hypothetical protein